MSKNPGVYTSLCEKVGGLHSGGLESKSFFHANDLWIWENIHLCVKESGSAHICVKKSGVYILGSRESPSTDFGSSDTDT